LADQTRSASFSHYGMTVLGRSFASHLVNNVLASS